LVFWIQNADLRAFELAVNNQSGQVVGIGDGTAGYVVQPGQARVQCGGTSLAFQIGSNATVIVDASGYDFSVLDQLRVSVSTNTVAVDAHSMTTTAGFFLGWGVGLTIFGFGWAMRLVRNITSHQVET
jgi:hypothetical protein